MQSRIAMPVLAVLLAFTTAKALAGQTADSTPSQNKAVAGDLEKVAADGKTMTLKTANGTEEVFKVTGKSTVDGAKDIALAGKEGTHVVVHYTAKGAEKTATGLEDVGKGTWKVTEGTVTKVAEDGKVVTLKLKDGTEKTFHVGKEATIETGKGVVDASKYTAKAGDKVVVYTTVDPTKEVVHLFKKI